MGRRRRDLLASVTAVTTAAIAGCSGGESSDDTAGTDGRGDDAGGDGSVPTEDGREPDGPVQIAPSADLSVFEFGDDIEVRFEGEQRTEGRVYVHCGEPSEDLADPAEGGTIAVGESHTCPDEDEVRMAATYLGETAVVDTYDATEDVRPSATVAFDEDDEDTDVTFVTDHRTDGRVYVHCGGVETDILDPTEGGVIEIDETVTCPSNERILVAAIYDRGIDVVDEYNWYSPSPTAGIGFDEDGDAIDVTFLEDDRTDGEVFVHCGEPGSDPAAPDDGATLTVGETATCTDVDEVTVTATYDGETAVVNRYDREPTLPSASVDFHVDGGDVDVQFITDDRTEGEVFVHCTDPGDDLTAPDDGAILEIGQLHTCEDPDTITVASTFRGVTTVVDRFDRSPT